MLNRIYVAFFKIYTPHLRDHSVKTFTNFNVKFQCEASQWGFKSVLLARETFLKIESLKQIDDNNKTTWQILLFLL